MAVTHCRIELQGTLSTNRDIWSTSFSTAPQADPAACASDVRDAFLNEVWNHGTSNAMWPQAVAFTAVKVSNYSSAGVVTATATDTTGLPALPTGTANQIPPECSPVVSLLTAHAGGSYRGRMYLPPLGANQLDADGQMSAGAAGNIADAMKRFFDAVNTTLVLGNVAVFSKTLGILTDVSTIKVGRTMDSQRRRRSAVPEAYTSRTLA
jgi:hypothetical protein